MSNDDLCRKYRALKYAQNAEKNGLTQVELTMIEKNQIPAFCYSRVSTAFQLSENSHSLETQVNNIQKYCELNNYCIVQHFEDAGISGGSIDNRPQLLLMLELLKPGYIVICASMSRLGRNVAQLLDITNRIRKAQADLVLLDINLNTSTSAGAAMFTIMAAMSQLERDQTSERVSNVLTHLSEEGKLITKPPYGYKRSKGGELEPKEDEQLIIEYVRRTVNNHPNITASKLTKIVNEKQMTNRKNKPFHVTTINSICRTHSIPLLNKNLQKEENIIPSKSKTDDVKNPFKNLSNIPPSVVPNINPFAPLSPNNPFYTKSE